MKNILYIKTKCGLFWHLFLLLFFIVCSNGYSVTDQVITNAAREGLNRYLDKIPAGLEKYYGFKSRVDFIRTSLGIPYKLYTISPDLIHRQPEADNLHVRPLGIWRFPVMCDGDITTLLTVANVKGMWRSVEIGGAGIASELNILENIYVNEEDSVQKAILRLYELKADFLILYNTNIRIEKGIFIPLQSARAALGLGQRELVFYYLHELLSLLKEKLDHLMNFQAD